VLWVNAMTDKNMKPWIGPPSGEEIRKDLIELIQLMEKERNKMSKYRQLCHDLAIWAGAHGFAPSHDESSNSFEISWDHSTGYGIVTFRVMAQGDKYPYSITVHSDSDRGINLGDVRTLDEVEQVYNCLSKLSYDNYWKDGKENK